MLLKINNCIIPQLDVLIVTKGSKHENPHKTNNSIHHNPDNAPKHIPDKCIFIGKHFHVADGFDRQRRGGRYSRC